MAEPLSDLERRVLDYLIDYLRANTYQPSIREIGRRFEIRSTKTVSELLQSLADKGWIERDSSRSRGVRLLGVSLSPRTVTVPWVERADASPGERVVDAFEFDPKLAGSAGTFITAMQGDSLASYGIREGDLLLVEPVGREDAEDGDIVVSRSGSTQSVMRLDRTERAIVAAQGSVQTPITEPVIIGRVVGIVRRLRVPIHQPTPREPAAAHGSP